LRERNYDERSPELALEIRESDLFT